MNTQLLALLHTGQATSKFGPTSRYHGIETAQMETVLGLVSFVRRRFLPDPGDVGFMAIHTMTQSERLDLLADAALGDSEQFWRLADANVVLNPRDLERVSVGVKVPHTGGG